MDMTELLRLLGLQQAYDVYQRNIGQPVANVAGPFVHGFLGLRQPEYGSEEAYRTGQAVGNMPGPNMPAGAIKMAAQVPGLLDVIQAAKNSPELTGLLGLTAYHGSPYRFSKFDPTKIGSGEGAQAYGYGHYFAESPDVAKGYRDKLTSGTNIDRHRRILSSDKEFYDEVRNMVLTARESQNFGLSSALQNVIENSLDNAAGLQKIKTLWLNQNPKKQIRVDEKQRFLEAIDLIENNPKVKGFLDKYQSTNPSFYTVDVPDKMIEKMLDWDKPLGQQSDIIQKLAKQAGLEMEDLGGDLVARFNAKTPEGAAFLKEQGIPGIKYFDQASRTKDGGTRNFVVFPGQEDLIEMLKVE